MNAQSSIPPRDSIVLIRSPGLLLELVRQRLDVVRASQGVDNVGRACLVGHQLRRAQRDLHRAFRLLVEGAELDAEEAVDWGLADVMFDSHDELLAWARTLAARLSRYPAGLLAQIKGQLAHGREPRDGQAFDRELTDLDSYP